MFSTVSLKVPELKSTYSPRTHRLSFAFLNVKINAAGLTDKAFAEKLIAEGNVIEEKTKALESEILKTVNSKI